MYSLTFIPFSAQMLLFDSFFLTIDIVMFIHANLKVHLKETMKRASGSYHGILVRPGFIVLPVL